MLGLYVVHKQDIIAQKVDIKCAKLVDETNDQLFCCLCVRDFELKILIEGVHLTNKIKMFDSCCFFRKKGIHINESKKAKKYMSPYYFLFYIQYKFMQKAEIYTTQN